MVKDRAHIVSRSMRKHLAELETGQKYDNSAVKAKMARLRNALYKKPGADPLLWDITSVDFDEEPISAEPSWEENAVHAALCLYARHQQSRNISMNDPNLNFSQAVAKLSSLLSTQESEKTAVRRRFNALATSSSLSELVRHAAGLIDQLRSMGIGFDYTDFADSLYYYQTIGGADKVRLSWARSYLQKPKQLTKTED